MSKKVLFHSRSADHDVVTHLCWDNFDLREETPSGTGTTHTAHGIIIQKVSEDARNDTVTPTTSDEPRTKGRSVRCSSEVLCLMQYLKARICYEIYMEKLGDEHYVNHFYSF